MSESAPRRVKIELRSSQEDGFVLLTYPGMLYPKPNAVYLKWEETDEERGRCSVTFKRDASGLTMLRHGDVNGEQRFVLGGRTTGWLQSPAGRLRLEMETIALESSSAATGGGLPFETNWQYELWVNEQQVGRFDLRLLVKEELES